MYTQVTQGFFLHAHRVNPCLVLGDKDWVVDLSPHNEHMHSKFEGFFGGGFVGWIRILTIAISNYIPLLDITQ